MSSITVGDDAHIVPQNNLSNYGLICDKYINNINIKYENIKIDNPNGPSGTPVPTNSLIAQFASTFNAKSYSFDYISSRDDEGIVPYKKHRNHHSLI